MTELQDTELDRLLKAAPLPELPPDLPRKITGTLTASLRPVKPMPSNLVLALQFVFIFVLVAAGMIGLMGVSGLRTLHPSQALGMIAILAVEVVLLSLVLAWQMRPGSRQRIPAKLSWACFGAGFLTGAALLFPWRAAPSFVSQGWPCLLTGSAIAIPGGILFWLLARRGIPLSPTAFGGTLGAIAGLLGMTVLQFRCIYQHAAHLLVWHGAILALAIAAGVWIARVMDRNRTSLGIEVENRSS